MKDLVIKGLTTDSYANFNSSEPADASQDFNKQDQTNLNEGSGRVIELEEVSKQGSVITV